MFTHGEWYSDGWRRNKWNISVLKNQIQPTLFLTLFIIILCRKVIFLTGVVVVETVGVVETVEVVETVVVTEETDITSDKVFTQNVVAFLTKVVLYETGGVLKQFYRKNRNIIKLSDANNSLTWRQHPRQILMEEPIKDWQSLSLNY